MATADDSRKWDPALTRRTLVVRAFQAGGLAALGGGFLAACGGGGSSTAPATTAAGDGRRNGRGDGRRDDSGWDSRPGRDAQVRSGRRASRFRSAEVLGRVHLDGCRGGGRADPLSAPAGRSAGRRPRVPPGGERGRDAPDLHARAGRDVPPRTGDDGRRREVLPRPAPLAGIRLRGSIALHRIADRRPPRGAERESERGLRDQGRRRRNLHHRARTARERACRTSWPCRSPRSSPATSSRTWATRSSTSRLSGPGRTRCRTWISRRASCSSDSPTIAIPSARISTESSGRSVRTPSSPCCSCRTARST